MTFNRRKFLATGIGLGTSVALAGNLANNARSSNSDLLDTRMLRAREQPLLGISHDVSVGQPAFSITPVVGDGKWIWRTPPNDQTGYLEPRDFEVSIGIEMKGLGFATNIKASTVAPVGHPEQEILGFDLESNGCEAMVSACGEGAAQLLLAARQIEKGQTISATARYKLRICKDYRGHDLERFSKKQKPAGRFPTEYLKNSPGIKSSAPIVKKLSRQIVDPAQHPWEIAQAYHAWVWKNIDGVPGKYTSVEQALKNRAGDCEERACVFIALCRSAGIPARQVWVPSHVWAEIGLHDEEGNAHWIPVHTAAYNWFGWTGVHEIVLQKGDRLQLANRKTEFRLVDDWHQSKGVRPTTRFTIKIRPLADEGLDAGPGGRQKLPDGQWKLVGSHPAQQYLRDG